MPATEDSSGLRSGFNCAIGVLAGTTIGDAMVRDCVHIARRVRVMRSCNRQVFQLQLEWEKVEEPSELIGWAGRNADANRVLFIFCALPFLVKPPYFSCLLYRIGFFTVLLLLQCVLVGVMTTCFM